ncbi:IMS domain-containing protein [Gloeocapsopsis sp. IPPAS B-1203]|uniref:IMS domain-containing protein n=1 Tax=Gloeocapsopsis sp. IPPAS B-1203 TaxID=2049454 RepID=UPI000C1A34C9|nr:IMS domain-containing protein [Gloeocapsopsis sp. IPPAS B-1203]PIG94362.1 hypothetical protein CSQ79_03440 [Gloeocapsopsis sp. IPPAS B-1203]
MTTLIRTSNHQPVYLVKQIASSGEGEVWQTNLNGYLAKIYHNPTPERIKKLEVMIANPPDDPMRRFNHTAIAWAKDLLVDQHNATVGFLMPAIQNSQELPSVYHPKLRKRRAPGFNWYYLHIAALNTAWIVQAIHAKGYVLGDIKPQNILVSDRALVAVIDTDSFQVRDVRSGEVYRCTVGSEGFTPVELLGQDFSTTDQTEVHDRFRLAVLIHYLLFGCHPFSGEWQGVGDPPEQNELIRRGFWAYSQNSLIRPSQNTIPLDVVHPEIKRCFLQCFNDGHTAPHLRPTAEDWHNALIVAIQDLAACNTLDSHHYSHSYGKCYWCERKATLGVDIFPGNPGTASVPMVLGIPRVSIASQNTTTLPSAPIQTVVTSTPSISQSFSSSLSATTLPQQLTHNTNTKVSLPEWQKAVLTGSVIGTFLFVGLLLTRQQPQYLQASPPQSVAPQVTSPPPETSSSVEPSTIRSDEALTTLRNTTPISVEREVSHQNQVSYSPPPSSISQQEAVALINRWQEYKRQLFAPPYERYLGDEILTGKAYHDNISRADGKESSSEWLENNGSYYTYGIQSIDSVENFAASGNQATIDLIVTEQRTLYGSSGRVDRNGSGFDTRLVRYNLQSINGQWKITDYHTVKTISKR